MRVLSFGGTPPPPHLLKFLHSNPGSAGRLRNQRAAAERLDRGEEGVGNI